MFSFKGSFIRSFLPVVVAVAVSLGVVVDASAASRDVELTGVVNLNTATESELRQLPGIGPAKAQRIMELRAKKRFASIEQLMNVKGIGRKTFRKLKANLAVTGETTIQRKAKTGGTRGTRPAAETEVAEDTGETEKPAPEAAAMPEPTLDAARARAEKRVAARAARRQ